MRLFQYCFLNICICLFCACSKQHAFYINQDLPESVWTYDNILKYEFDVADTNDLYDLNLDINYKTNFPNQNVYVNIYTGQQSDNMKKTTLSLDLSNNLGIWKGECNVNACNYILPLQKSIFFEQVGRHLFWVEQYSRTDSLKGISSISLVGDIVGNKRIDNKQ